MRSKLVFSLIVSFVLAVISTQAPAGIIGVNSLLQSNKGKILIPLQVSGELGTPIITGGPGSKPINIGVNSDRVQLTGIGAISRGEVSFGFDFAMPSGVDWINNDNSAMLTLTLKDFDFQPTVTRTTTFYETMTLSLMTGSGSASTTVATITLDKDNYGEFCTTGFAKTNNKQLTYQFNNENLAEFWNVDGASIVTGGEFHVDVTLNSFLQQNVKGTHTYRNTPESIKASLDFTPFIAPEPVTLLMLVSGSLAMLARRKK